MPKHKVLIDFHLMGHNKNIITLKSGTILEDYIYKKGSSNEINVGKDAVERNGTYFEIFDWKAELTSYLKLQKLPQPSILSKKIQPFIQDMFITNAPSGGQTITIEKEVEKIKEVVKEIDNPEHLKTIESLKKRLKEKDSEIEELNNRILKKDNFKNKEFEDREKDLEFLKNQLDKKKQMLEDLDFELENRIKEVKNREFEVLTWENRANQSMINLQEALDKISIIEKEAGKPVIDNPHKQAAEEIKRGWDGIYRGAH